MDRHRLEKHRSEFANRTKRMGTSLIALWLSAAIPAGAFSYPLSPEQVREAYFLGRSTDDEKVVRFIEPYVHRLPYPKKGPFVESVEFRSPYEQVVLRTRQKLTNYSSQDAEQDYSKHPALVIVRVMIFLTFTYHGPAVQSPDGAIRFWTDEDFLKEFQFQVAQVRPIQPEKITVGPGCPPPNWCEPFDGREVLLQFDAAQFTSGTLAIRIQTPDGQLVQTKFDLDNLK
jgi:hypothetical protein